MGKLFLGILGALGNSYSMLQSTNNGLEKSLPGGGAINPLVVGPLDFATFDGAAPSLLDPAMEVDTGVTIVDTEE